MRIYQNLLLLLLAISLSGCEVNQVFWSFDQGQNVATVTTRQVMHENFPVLSVVHYADDHSWAFTCNTGRIKEMDYANQELETGLKSFYD